MLATLPPVLADSPYAKVVPAGLASCVPIEDLANVPDLLRVLQRFAPDVTLIVGWDVDAYRRVARSMRSETIRVLCTDNQWLGTARQWLGIASSPWYLHGSFDRMFVPGERQRRFARQSSPRESTLVFTAPTSTVFESAM